jgi:hypothetical protein
MEKNIVLPIAKKVILDKIEFNLMELLPDHYLQDVDFSAVVDSYTRGVVFRFRGFLYGKEHIIENEKDDYIMFPESWFQMFKSEFLPHWLLAHFPIKKRKYSFKVKTIYKVTNVCPHLNIKSDRNHVEWISQEPIFSQLTKHGME